MRVTNIYRGLHEELKQAPCCLGIPIYENEPDCGDEATEKYIRYELLSQEPVNKGSAYKEHEGFFIITISFPSKCGMAEVLDAQQCLYDYFSGATICYFDKRDDDKTTIAIRSVRINNNTNNAGQKYETEITLRYVSRENLCCKPNPITCEESHCN